jgi:hypothetical protein
MMDISELSDCKLEKQLTLYSLLYAFRVNKNVKITYSDQSEFLKKDYKVRNTRGGIKCVGETTSKHPL